MHRSQLLLPLHLSTFHPCHLSVSFSLSAILAYAPLPYKLFKWKTGAKLYVFPFFVCIIVPIYVSDSILPSVCLAWVRFHALTCNLFCLALKHHQHVRGNKLFWEWEEREKRKERERLCPQRYLAFPVAQREMSRESCLFYKAHTLSFMCVCLC